MPLHDRYPDADVLAQRGHWDDATRQVVLDRVHNVPDVHATSTPSSVPRSRRCARGSCRKATVRRSGAIPIAPWIDQRCASRATDGFRFDDMPPNELAWTWGLDGLDQTAQALFGESATFRSLDRRCSRTRSWKSIRAGDPPGEVWRRIPGANAGGSSWPCGRSPAIYYAHPYAWDEIGFGGPAYPRGYFALNFGAPEPWEAREAPTPRSTEDDQP